MALDQLPVSLFSPPQLYSVTARGLVAFRQGLAFNLCVSTLTAEEVNANVLLRKTYRLRRKTHSTRLSPPAVSRLRRSILDMNG